ncbi:MAG: type 4a pilus biogenesis protein PilO [Pseudomonadales bacterium]|jgi:type IV pilus assembly protein PilO
MSRLASLRASLNQLGEIDLAELDFSRIGSWPAAIRWLLMTFAFLAVMGAGYYLLLTDKIARLDHAVREEQNLRDEFGDKSEQVANLEIYRQQKVEMEATFGNLLRQLPSDTEVPALLEDITRAALDNGLTIESITLQPERPSQFYVELPIDITVEGNYHRLGQFVSAVADLSRIVTLHDFSIGPEARKGPTPADALRMTVQARTYRYLEE